jgi:hypothetical protein
MKDSRPIVICGESIYMLAIESGLSMMAGGNTILIKPSSPNPIENIRELDPHVVIMERSRKTNSLALELLYQSIPLLILDEAQRSIIVLAMEQVSKDKISDLISAIEKVNQKHDALT